MAGVLAACRRLRPTSGQPGGVEGVSAAYGSHLQGSLVSDLSGRGDAVTCIVTLVHGTWGRGWDVFGCRKLQDLAPWTRPDGPLATALRDALGPDTRIEAFNWSGRNGHDARIDASARLREQLRAQPGAVHILIAHSHGGNVAHWAVDESVLPSIAGMACLGTPFIVSYQRDWGPEVWTLAASGLTLIAFGLMAFADLEGWTGFVITVGAGGLLGAVLGALAGPITRRFEANAEALERLTQAPRLKDTPLLIVRSPADEASLMTALPSTLLLVPTVLFGFLRDLSRRLLVGVNALAERPWLCVGILLMSWLCLALGLLFAAKVAPSLGIGLADWQLLALFGAFAISNLTALCAFAGHQELVAYSLPMPAAALALLIVPVTVAVTVPVFGLKSAVASVVLNWASEATPLGEHRIHLVPPSLSVDTGDVSAPRSHAVHSNAIAHRLIADWAARCVANRATGATS